MTDKKLLRKNKTYVKFSIFEFHTFLFSELTLINYQLINIEFIACDLSDITFKFSDINFQLKKVISLMN